ncbi:MAG: nucleotidyltransferase domain-containing protein [Deltaproteobacteria bacterium]|nr:nucleotidyltransferase domain-containing protein [Deltaproteobacteria bacterium]
MISLRSQITKHLLGFLFIHEKESFYINQLARELNVDRGNLIRKLSELEKEGLLQSEYRGHQRYYSLNRKYPLYSEYRDIIRKTIGLEAELTRALKQIGGIQKAYLFGSYAKDKMNILSDIDLLVIGQHQSVSLYEKLSGIQKQFGRTINAMSMGPLEFERKKKGSFLSQVLKGIIIELV